MSIQYSTAFRRRWADDILEAYSGGPREQIASAVRDRMHAACDCEDIAAGVSIAISEEEAVIHTCYPLVGVVDIGKGGTIRRCTDLDYEALEAHGIHIAWEWRDDPQCEMLNGSLSRIYIGRTDCGPVAMYDADYDRWYTLSSNGNYGKKYACGGTWKSVRLDYGCTPAIVREIEHINYNRRAL